MPHRAQLATIDGILVVNKPQGRTSHDIVEWVRRIIGFRQIGHFGTLDPMATGVLVLALGRATRLARFFAGRRKRYSCAMRFGFSTDTYDASGQPQGPDMSPKLDWRQIEALAARFLGRTQQTPPPFSAKKIHGRPAHELARRHKTVDLEPVEVEVFEFRLTELAGAVARFEIECGAGTYIRALAHDMGRLAGCGAHLAEITRTAVGEFTLEQALSISELQKEAEALILAARVIRLENLLPDLPRTTVLPILERRIRHGARFHLSLAQIQPGNVTTVQGTPRELDSSDGKPGKLRVFNQQGELIAIAEPVVPRTYQPVLVFESSP
jgi:tRNA pseudouridine55 synthase